MRPLGENILFRPNLSSRLGPVRLCSCSVLSHPRWLRWAHKTNCSLLLSPRNPKSVAGSVRADVRCRPANWHTGAFVNWQFEVLKSCQLPTQANQQLTRRREADRKAASEKPNADLKRVAAGEICSGFAQPARSPRATPPSLGRRSCPGAPNQLRATAGAA